MADDLGKSFISPRKRTFSFKFPGTGKEFELIKLEYM